MIVAQAPLVAGEGAVVSYVPGRGGVPAGRTGGQRMVDSGFVPPHQVLDGLVRREVHGVCGTWE